MAWVRIDDKAMDHQKILKLSPAQFQLWVKGLCYCQKHLTDGFIPDEAIKVLLGRANDVQKLCEVALWEAREGGFQVHDYLDWNDSRERVQERLEASEAEKHTTRDRLKRWREAKKQKRNGECNGVTSAFHETLPKRIANANVTVLTKPNQTNVQKDPPVEALSGVSPPPLPPRGKQYARIHVFPWQIDELINTLGPHAKDFELDAWIYGLSALADSKGLILSTKQAVWAWVQSELLAEVKRRQLPIAGESSVETDEDRLAKVRASLAEQRSWSQRSPHA